MENDLRNHHFRMMCALFTLSWLAFLVSYGKSFRVLLFSGFTVEQQIYMG